MNKKIQSLSTFSLNTENPFMKQTLVQVGDFLTTRRITATNQDESSIAVGVDPKTGEVLGHTLFARTKVVDSETFCKVYKIGFSAFADMTTSSMKVFQYILGLVRPTSDEFVMTSEEVCTATGYTKMTIYRALGALCTKGIIARGKSDTHYFINPMYIFNGDRVTFMTTWINENCPEKYKTNTMDLKGTIDIMKTDGFLPSDKKSRQLELPFMDKI